MPFEKTSTQKLPPSILKTPEVDKSNISSGRVDINDLIARVRKEKDAENRSTLVFFCLFAFLLIIVGILLSF
jgi:hypothetical protein